MKTSAILKNKYVGDYWSYLEKEIGNTITNEYFFIKKIRFTMGTTSNSDRINFYSEFLLKPGSWIKNIYDSNNTNVQPNSYWSITNAQPVLNSFNQIIGYKYKAIRQEEI